MHNKERKLDLRVLSVNLCGLSVLTLLAAACGPSPRPIPPLPARDTGHALLPDAPQVIWRNDVGSGLLAHLEARGPALFATTTNRTVVALAQTSGRRFWLQRFAGAITTGAAVAHNQLFFATEDLSGQAHALDVTRGRRLWSRRIGPARLPPVLLEDRVLFATDRGQLYALRKADGQVLWQVEFPAALALTPVPFENSVITATSGDSLYVLSQTDGAVLRRVRLSATPSAPAVLRGDTVLMPLHNATVIGLNARTLELLFEIRLDATALAAPRCIDQATYLLSRSAVLWRVEGSRAERMVELQGAARASLAEVDGHLVIGLLDGRLIALDPSGRRRWQQQLPRSVVAPAVARGSALFVPLINGEIWKLSDG